MILLSVKEIAEIKGVSPRYIRKQVLDKKISVVVDKCNNKDGKRYLIPITELTPKEQIKYYKSHNITLPSNLNPSKKLLQNDIPTKAFEKFTTDQRQTIDQWSKIVNDWNEFTLKSENCKTEATADYIKKIKTIYPDIQISQSILYRKAKALKENNLSGLIDNRGLWKKGTSSIPDDMWQCFLSFYLDESQHPLKCCYDYTKMWIEQELPGIGTIPSYTTFYRRVQSEVS